MSQPRRKGTLAGSSGAGSGPFLRGEPGSVTPRRDARGGHADGTLHPLGDEREQALAKLAELSRDFDHVLFDVAAYVVLRRLGVDGGDRRLYGSQSFGAMQASFVFASPVVVAVVTDTLDRSPVLSWLAFAAIWVVRLWLPLGDRASATGDRVIVGWPRPPTPRRALRSAREDGTRPGRLGGRAIRPSCNRAGSRSVYSGSGRL
jgi:hypothetical protein